MLSKIVVHEEECEKSQLEDEQRGRDNIDYIEKIIIQV